VGGKTEAKKVGRQKGNLVVSDCGTQKSKGSEKMRERLLEWWGKKKIQKDTGDRKGCEITTI